MSTTATYKKLKKSHHAVTISYYGMTPEDKSKLHEMMKEKWIRHEHCYKRLIQSNEHILIEKIIFSKQKTAIKCRDDINSHFPRIVSLVADKIDNLYMGSINSGNIDFTGTSEELKNFVSETCSVQSRDTKERETSTSGPLFNKVGTLYLDSINMNNFTYNGITTLKEEKETRKAAEKSYGDLDSLVNFGHACIQKKKGRYESSVPSVRTPPSMPSVRTPPSVPSVRTSPSVPSTRLTSESNNVHLFGKVGGSVTMGGKEVGLTTWNFCGQEYIKSGDSILILSKSDSCISASKYEGCINLAGQTVLIPPEIKKLKRELAEAKAKNKAANIEDMEMEIAKHKSIIDYLKINGELSKLGLSEKSLIPNEKDNVEEELKSCKRLLVEITKARDKAIEESSSKKASESTTVTEVLHECCICMDAPATNSPIPCGHMCLCGDCATIVTKCPLCTREFTDTIKIYIP